MTGPQKINGECCEFFFIFLAIVVSLYLYVLIFLQGRRPQQRQKINGELGEFDFSF